MSDGIVPKFALNTNQMEKKIEKSLEGRKINLSF